MFNKKNKKKRQNTLYILMLINFRKKTAWLKRSGGTIDLQVKCRTISTLFSLTFSQKTMVFYLRCRPLLVHFVNVSGVLTKQGLPALDEIAGEWLTMTNVDSPPDVHNFNHMLVVKNSCHYGQREAPKGRCRNSS